MPVPTHQETEEIKGCLLTARRKDATSVKIRKNKDYVRFKVHCSRFFYTPVIRDQEDREAEAIPTPPSQVWQ